MLKYRNMDDLKFVLKQLVDTKLTAADTDYLNFVRTKDDAEVLMDTFYKNKMFEIDKNLRVEALTHVLKNRYINYYNTLIETEAVEELLPTLKKIKEQQDNQDNITNSDIMFLTLSPAAGEMTPLNFVKLLDRFTRLGFIKQYVYVIEQRYNGIPNEKYKNLGDGMHAHILLDKGTYKLSHIKRDCRRVFQGFVINYDFGFRRRRDILKTQGYIVGKKKDVDKQKKQEHDALYREREGLKKFYGNLWESIE